MTITYSGDPTASALDEIRFLLADTDVTAALFSDEEIAYFIGRERSTIYAAAAGAEVLAARYAGTPGSRTLGDVTVSYSDMCTRYTALAQTLRRSAQTALTSLPVPFMVAADRVMPTSTEWSNQTDGGNAAVADLAPDYG